MAMATSGSSEVKASVLLLRQVSVSSATFGSSIQLQISGPGWVDPKSPISQEFMARWANLLLEMHPELVLVE